MSLKPIFKLSFDLEEKHFLEDVWP